MKRKYSTVVLDRDQQKTMCKVARLWSTVYNTTYSQVQGLLIETNNTQQDGTGIYSGGDGSVHMANFILSQVIAPDTTELMAMEYARMNPEGNFAKFYQDADNLATYITNSYIKQQNDASNTNSEHAGAAAATA